MTKNKTSKTDQTDVIANKMKASLESTSKGLALFSDSLQKSGLHSSLSAYQQMMSVLIQQKNWTDTNSRTEMQPLWNEIAKNSEDMYQIMNAYSNIMNSLRTLNANNLQKNKTKQSSDTAANLEKILEYMKKYSEFPISDISENLNLKKKEIKEELDPLVKKGKIERKGRGKTLSYRLKETQSNSAKTKLK